MSDINPPTCKDLDKWADDGPAEWDFEEVQRHSDPSWRHGTRETVVFRRKSDGTFWRAKYRRSTDGETDELREGCADIDRVYPHEVTAIEYRVKP